MTSYGRCKRCGGNLIPEFDVDKTGRNIIGLACLQCSHPLKNRNIEAILNGYNNHRPYESRKTKVAAG